MSAYQLDESTRKEFETIWEQAIGGISLAHPTVDLVPGAPASGVMRDLVPNYPSILVVAGSTGPAGEFSWGILLDAAAAAAAGDVAVALAGPAGVGSEGSENSLVAVAAFAADIAQMVCATLGGDSGWQTTPGWQGLLERGHFVDVPEGQMAPAPGLERLLSPGARVIMADVAVSAGEDSAPTLHFLFEPAIAELLNPASAGPVEEEAPLPEPAAEPAAEMAVEMVTPPTGTAAAEPGEPGFQVIRGEKGPESGHDRVIGVPAPRVTARRAAFEQLTEGQARRSPEELQAGIGLLMDVPLQISVELGRTRRKVREIMALAPGSVVELDRLAGEPVDVLVNGKLLGKGEVVVINENFAIRITDIVSPAERVQELA